MDVRAGTGEAASTAATATGKPEACFNCAEGEPESRAVLPGVVGTAGIPVKKWLCGECLGMLRQGEKESARAKAKLAASKKRRTKGRLALGVEDVGAMALAYRLGGFTARQVSALWLLEDPSRFGEARRRGEAAAVGRIEGESGPVSKMGEGERADVMEEVRKAGEESALAAGAKAASAVLARLRRAKLMRSLSVRREHHRGAVGGRGEEYYHLSKDAVAWAGREAGEEDPREAAVAYHRHQLPRRAEHSAYRNDVLLALLRDAADSGQEPDPAGVSRFGLADFMGESHGDYPYKVALLPKPWRGGRKWEVLVPDGRAGIRWGDGLECSFDVEAERESWATEAARKIDRYGAAWLRLYREMEKEHRPEQLVAMEEDMKRRERERAALVRQSRFDRDAEYPTEEARDEALEAADEASRVLNDRGSELHELRVERARAELRRMREESVPPFLGLPQEARPVLFVHLDAGRSENARRKVRDRAYPTPRYDEFREAMVEARERGRASLNKKLVKAGREELSAEEFRAHTERMLDSLFVFAEFGEVSGIGGTLDEIWSPLWASDAARRVGLRMTAKIRGSLSTEG